MSIGYLIPEFPGQTHVFFWRELLALRQAGADISLISTRRPAEQSCKHDFAAAGEAQTHYVFPPCAGSVLSTLAGRFWRVPAALAYIAGLRETSVKGRLRYLPLLACAMDLKRFADRNSIEHIHGHSCADAAHLLALCKILGGPSYSLTLHGDLPVYGRNHAAKMKDADFVAVVGRHLKEQVVSQIGLPADRIQETFMGLDTQAFVPPRERSSKPKSLHVVTIARLNAAKGHFHALAAIRRAIDAGMDVTYSIAGAGPHKAAIVAEITRLSITQHVKMLGTLPENRVLELLNSADAFLLPSVGLGEAWPVSVMEAMACGLPVISSIIGATPEMIRTGFDGILVEQRDENALADAIIFLAGDVDARLEMGRAARRSAEERFDVQVSARRLLNRIQLNTPESKQNSQSLEGARPCEFS